MKSKSRHINVRFDSELYGVVEKVATENRMTKSEVVRTALEGELSKIDARKNKTLSDEDRERMLKNMGTMMTSLSSIRNDNAKYGNNINQMVKAINKGETSVSGIQLNGYVQYGDKVEKYLETVAEELNRIWHTLA